MPVSKRDKKVSLTKTTKKGMKLKQQVVEDIRKCLEEYSNVFVFNISNMRTGPMSEIRENWKGSRIFLAKRKVMAVALGRTPETEVKKNLHKVAAYMSGECGLLFTKESKQDVVRWFKKYTRMDYAKAGFVPSETVVLPKGPLTEFSFSIEPHLRSLGLPTELQKGVIMLREDYTVCEAGTKLNPAQAQILKLIEKPLTEFKIKVVCVWSQDGSFEKFKGSSISTPDTSFTKQSNHENSSPVEGNGKTIFLKKEVSNDITDVNVSSLTQTPQKKHKTSKDLKNDNNLEDVKPPVKFSEASPRKKVDSPLVKQEVMEQNENLNNVKKTPRKKSGTPKQSKEAQDEEEKLQSLEEELMQVDISSDLDHRTQNEHEQNSKTPTKSENIEKSKTPLKDKTPEKAQTPEKTISPEKAKTPNKSKTPKKVNKSTIMTSIDEENTDLNDKSAPEELEGEEMSEGQEKEEAMNVDPSPKLGKSNPRRSLRTPKPIKRTPEQRRLSLKKLTTSKTAKTSSETPSETKGTPIKSLGTPRKSKSTPKEVKATPTRQSTRVSRLLKVQEDTGDIEMS